MFSIVNCVTSEAIHDVKSTAEVVKFLNIKFPQSKGSFDGYFNVYDNGNLITEDFVLGDQGWLYDPVLIY